MIDWFFVLDIVLNFFTGVDVGGSVHTDQKYIVRHYLQTWFVIDFASSLPLDFVISLAFDGCPPDENVNSDNISYLKLIRILRLTKLLKLLRLLKLNSLLDTLQDQFPINQAVTKSMTLLCVVFYLAHITGCCWYAVGASAWGDYNASAVDDDFEAVSWLSTAGLTPDSALSERYTASLYWAFTTMTAVGYGDLIPQTSMERLFAVLAMMIGATVFGYVVGNATTIIANSDATSAQFHARMESLNQYMSERALPRALQVRIRKYFRYLYLKKTVFSNEEVILDDLSIQLRNELLLHMHRDLINQIRLFQRVTDPGFIDLMVRAMKPLFCSPEDVIVEEGKQGVEMYWLIKGNVEVLFAGVGKTINARAKGLLVDGSKPAAQPGGVEVEVEERASANFERSMSYKFDATTAVNLGTLRPGDYFGEIALMPLQAPGLEANRRTATVRALKNYCDLQAIGRETLLRCFSEFPEVEKEFFTLAKKRIEVLTDLDKQEDAVSSAGASMGSRGFTGLFYRPKDGQETFGTDMTAVISSLQQGIRLAEEESDVERRPCTRWHAMRLGTGHVGEMPPGCLGRGRVLARPRVEGVPLPIVTRRRSKTRMTRATTTAMTRSLWSTRWRTSPRCCASLRRGRSIRIPLCPLCASRLPPSRLLCAACSSRVASLLAVPAPPVSAPSLPASRTPRSRRPLLLLRSPVQGLGVFNAYPHRQGRHLPSARRSR